MKRSIIQSFFFVFSIVVFVYVCGIGLKNVFRYNTFKLEKKRLVATLDQERKKNRQLKLELSKMESDEYWEYQAKLKLGYLKENEVEYRFIRRESAN